MSIEKSPLGELKKNLDHIRDDLDGLIRKKRNLEKRISRITEEVSELHDTEDREKPLREHLEFLRSELLTLYQEYRKVNEQLRAYFESEDTDENLK